MNYQKWYTTFLFSLLFGHWLAAFPSGTITHQPVIRHPSGEPLVLYAMVSSEVDVQDVRFLYRRLGETGFVEEYMEKLGEMWRGEIPVGYLTAEEIQYFIAATLVDGSIITFPENDPENNLIKVRITPALVEEELTAKVREEVRAVEATVPAVAEGSVLIFSPDPGSTVPFDDVYISASLFNIDSVDVSSIRLFVDHRDVTQQSAISSDVVAYGPPFLPPGEHTIRVELRTLQNLPVPPQTWSFSVTGERVEEVEREFSYRGRWNGGYSLDQIEDETLAIAKTTVSMTGEWRWLRAKTDLKLTTEEDPFKQPRNRYRFLLNAGRYFALALGDVNTRLSKFSLDGKRVRGVDADLRLGWINLRLVRGEVDRVIQGRRNRDESLFLDKIVVEQNAQDSTQNDFIYTLNRKGYTFRKNIFAGRLSFGRGKKFQLGFNWLKAKDNIGSVQSIIDDAKITIGQDSSGTIPLAIGVGTYTYNELEAEINAHSTEGYRLDIPEKHWSGDAPQDNIVIGSDIRFFLDHRRIGVEAGWAFSMLNTDIWEGAFSRDNLDTLGFLNDSLLDGKIGDAVIPKDPLTGEPFDPGRYEDIFVLSMGQIPLIPIDTLWLAEDPLRAVLNMPSLAYSFKTMVNYLNNQLTFEYVNVGPEFNSLGNPYLQKNNRQYSISDRVRLFSNRLFLNVMYKHQDDDILRTVTNVTTTNTLTTGISFFPGPDLPSINLTLRSQDRDNGKTTLDTVGVDSVTGSRKLEDLRDFTNTLNTTIGLNYRVNLFGLSHNISTNYISVVKADQFDDRPAAPFYQVSQGDTSFFDSSFVSPDLGSDVVTISVVTQYPIPLRTATVLSYNKSKFGRHAIYGTQGISTYSVNAVYDLFRGRLRLLGGVDYTSGSGNDEFGRMGVRAGFNYRIMDTFTFRMTGEFRSKNVSGETKTSTLVRASLNYAF